MSYERFREILDEQIFEESKSELLKKIAANPERYVGLFRPTKPKGKLLQNLLQSHEIRFGDAIEIVLQEYIELFGGEILENKLKTVDGDNLDVDQIFRLRDHVFFVEQKVRDDHDSTKKRGQIQNFERKLVEISKVYGTGNLTGFFYFIDPDFRKNRNYYRDQLMELQRAYGVELRLSYGGELFQFIGHSEAWQEFQSYLPRWKAEVPDLPETNFDNDPQRTFAEIKDLNPLYFRAIFSDVRIYEEIVLTLFPQKLTLLRLLEYFQHKAAEYPIYSTLASLLDNRLNSR